MISNLKENYRKLSISRRILVFVLVVLVMITLFGFLRTIIHGYRFGFYSSKLNQRTVDPVYLIGNIEPWMSFEYLNYSFNLPPEYLRDTLNISDKHYPRISLAHYSRNTKIDIQQLIKETRSSILVYQGKNQ